MISDSMQIIISTYQNHDVMEDLSLLLFYPDTDIEGECPGSWAVLEFWKNP